MNSADRSIALVDNAIRRRFSFVRLNPDYEILKKYLDSFGYPSESLIHVLKEVNDTIDDPNYEIGISYFVKDANKLKENLPDIWMSEVEPYLEEYFYDQLKKIDSFKWDTLSKNKLKEWAK
jgi:5-methylcytosine-specific restriction protein B